MAPRALRLRCQASRRPRSLPNPGRGEFTRIESRLAVFDPLYVANRGKSGFTIEADAGVPLIEADCEALERAVTVRFVELDLKKLTYGCEFSGTESTSEMRFVLGEPEREGFREKLLARERRAGEASVLGRDFVFESVHEYAGSRLDAQVPLGYLIKSDDTVVAAVDLLDWNPIVHLHSTLIDSERKAAMIVALSLAVLRDRQIRCSKIWQIWTTDRNESSDSLRYE